MVPINGFTATTDTVEPISTSGKVVWNGMLYVTNVPDPSIYTSHHMPKLPQIQRNSVSSFATTWPDATDLPTTAWYDDLAIEMTVNKYFRAPHDWCFFDVETWDESTDEAAQAARLATATKFATFAQAVRTRLPWLKFGFYNLGAGGSWFGATAPIGSATYTAWQAVVEDYAEAYPYVDAFMPATYLFYTRATDNPQAVSLSRYFIVNTILEQQRMVRKYAPGKPIWPFVWPRRHDNTDLLDLDVWELQVRLTYQYADGMVVWQTIGRDWAVDSLQPWWANILAPIMLSGRFPSPAVPR